MRDDWTPEARAEQLRLTAHHEAGHVVAYMMRGGAEFRAVSIDLDHPEHSGFTQGRAAPWDLGFISYAGPWAEARANWGDRPLDECDDEGCEFFDYLGGVYLTGAADGDRPAIEAHFAEPWSALASRGGTEAAWELELERVWPAVRTIAQRLVDGDEVTPQDVEQALVYAEGAER